MSIPLLACALLCAAGLVSCASTEAAQPVQARIPALQVQYLEIVTPEVDATCRALEAQHDVTFSAPVPLLGQARTVALENGGMLSVRAPMHAAEQTVVRPYLLVDDIAAAVEAAQAAGADFAMLPTELPGQGWFAIYFLGGIEHGIWQK